MLKCLAPVSGCVLNQRYCVLRYNVLSMFKLNSRQQEAVKYIEAPLLVLAGAGSGKTRVITRKIIYLIQDCQIPAARIAAVTFTNKAAKEMKSRVSRSLDKSKTAKLNVSTFHTLGLKIVRSEREKLGFRRPVSIYDAQDSQSLLKQLAPQSLNKLYNIDELQQKISNWKNQRLSPQDVISVESALPKIEAIAALYSEYNRHLKAYSAVDFDDLICLPVQLLSTDAEVREKWQNRIRYLLVDEYQDTNSVQYELVKLLVGPRAALTVVGDDDQSVYAWRGAKPENLAQLKLDFPNLHVIKLEQNYRSMGNILKAANSVISNNDHIFEKQLWSELGIGEPLKVLEAKDDENEAERVVSHLLHHKFQNRTDFSDYAILYRGNHQSRIFERTLRDQQIPYRLTGGTSFFSYTEVKDILAYLRLLANDDDDQAFIRVVNTPRREIGPSTLEKLANYANERQVSLCTAGYEMGLAQVLPERQLKRVRDFVEWLAHMSDRMQRGDLVAAVRDLVDDIVYKAWLEDICSDLVTAERKMENVYELIDWIEHLVNVSLKEPTLSNLVQHLTLQDMLDKEEEERSRGCVQLMTLHSAKGLEFPHVYLVGMEENLLPHHACLDDRSLAEERRLAYVGITRAEKSLVFSYAAKRKRYGEEIVCEPSRFLTEIPEDILQWDKPEEKPPEQRQQTGKAHLQNLRGLLGEV